MFSKRFLFSLAVFAILSTTCQAQQVKDPADLFPPDSLLYLEVVKPAEISREVVSTIRGTVLDDMVTYMAKWHEKDPNGFFGERQVMSMLSIFASPEFLAEAARLQGAAVAITGVNKKQEPEVVFVLLTGQSNFPAFFLRTILLSLDTRIAGQVEGVTIFGNRPFMFRQVAAPVANPPVPGAPPPPPPPPPPLEPPFIATLPGVIILGGTVESVGDVVKRIKSKEKRPAPSDDAEFKESSALRRKAGLFTYANPGRALDAIAKANPKTLQEEEARAIVEMLNPKAIRSLASNLSLAEGAIQFQIGARLEPGKSSPALDLIADQRVSLPLFQPVPKDSIVAFSLALTDGEKHWNRLLAAVDATVGKDVPKPSKQIQEIEDKLKISIGKEIAGRIAAVTVAMPAKQELPKGASEIPMLFIAGNDPGAAEQLERLLPQVLSIFSGEPIDPVTQTIDGIKIRSATGANFPWKAPLHYGRSGTTLAIGIDRKLVASSLSGKIASSAISESKLVEVIKEHDRAAAVGLWRWAGLLPEAIVEMTNQRQWGPNGQPLAPDPAAQREKAEKLRKSMEGLIRDMPPLVVSIGRDDRQIVLRVLQRQSPGAIPKLIEDLIDGIMRGATNIFNPVPAPAAPAPVKN